MVIAIWDFPIALRETDHKESWQILLTIRYSVPLLFLYPMYTEACKRDKKWVSCRPAPRYLRVGAIRY